MELRQQGYLVQPPSQTQKQRPYLNLICEITQYLSSLDCLPAICLPQVEILCGGGSPLRVWDHRVVGSNLVAVLQIEEAGASFCMCGVLLPKHRVCAWVVNIFMRSEGDLFSASAEPTLTWREHVFMRNECGAEACLAVKADTARTDTH